MRVLRYEYLRKQKEKKKQEENTYPISKVEIEQASKLAIVGGCNHDSYFNFILKRELKEFKERLKKILMGFKFG